MSKSLTLRQKRALELIEQSISDRGMAPTLSEMQEEMGITTKKGVAFHLDALERKGFIERTGLARGIRLISDRTGKFLRVPLIGYANAGEPLIDAKEEFIGELTVDASLLTRKRPLFGIEIRGDSMDKKIINGVPMSNGNYVIVHKGDDFTDGDVVLAIVNEAATIKTLKQEKEMYVLYPESTNEIHKPIYMDRSEGSVVGKILTVLNNPQKE